MFGLMGNCITWAKGKKEARRSVTLLAVGLDNAGKTTTVHGVKGEPNDDVAPTIGFSSVDLSSGKYDIKIYDLGGGPRIRGIWHNYMAEAHAIIFVIDSSDVERMEECRVTFEELVSDFRIRGKPVLILANKQDKPNAMDENDLCDRLNLEEVVNRNECLSKVEHCSALLPKQNDRWRRKRRLDRGIKTGFAWLLDVLGKEYDVLQQRIDKQVLEQKEREREERIQKIERVRKIREERERQENENAEADRPRPDGISFSSEVHENLAHNETVEGEHQALNGRDPASFTIQEPQGQISGLGSNLLDDNLEDSRIVTEGRSGLIGELEDDDHPHSDDKEEDLVAVTQDAVLEDMVLPAGLPGAVISRTIFSEANKQQAGVESRDVDVFKEEVPSDVTSARSLSKASLREIVQDTPSPLSVHRTKGLENRIPTPVSVTSEAQEEKVPDSESTVLTEDTTEKIKKKRKKKKRKRPNKVDPIQNLMGSQEQSQPLPGRLTPLKSAPIPGEVK